MVALITPTRRGASFYRRDVHSKKRKVPPLVLQGCVPDPTTITCSTFSTNATVSAAIVTTQPHIQATSGSDAFDIAIDRLHLDKLHGMDTSNQVNILELEDLGEPSKKKAAAIDSSCDRPRVVRLFGIEPSRKGTSVEHQERSREEERTALSVEGEHLRELGASARALNFTAAMQQLHSNSPFHEVKLFESIIMANLAEAFFDQQRKFAMDGKDATVSIGYHFTQERNLDDIQRHGLMSRKERVSKNIYATRRSGYYGEGIYTGNNPCAFTTFGPVGLLVATLKGKSERVGPRGGLNHNSELDSCVGNKNMHDSSLPKDDFRARFTDEIVLKRASQVLPLMIFPTKLVSGGSRSDDANTLWKCHLQIQKVVDDLFHCGIASVIKRVTPPLEHDVSAFCRNRRLMSVTPAHQPGVPTVISVRHPSASKASTPAIISE